MRPFVLAVVRYLFRCNFFFNFFIVTKRIYMTTFFSLFVHFFLSMFLEGIAIYVLTLPVVYPLIMMLGYDGILFGVVMIFVMNMGLLTPPLGLSVYIISGIVKDVPIQRIFKGVTP